MGLQPWFRTLGTIGLVAWRRMFLGHFALASVVFELWGKMGVKTAPYVIFITEIFTRWPYSRLFTRFALLSHYLFLCLSISLLGLSLSHSVYLQYISALSKAVAALLQRLRQQRHSILACNSF